MIHVAGPYVDLVQTCVRCGLVIADHRGAMYPIGDPPPSGWEEGSHVEIFGRNPTCLYLTGDPADCEPVQ